MVLGLIASVGSSGNESDIDLVKDLAASYISKPSCIILLTVACESTPLRAPFGIDNYMTRIQPTFRIKVLIALQNSSILKESEL